MNPELALTAAFVAGFFGSTHCIGMCGAIVVLFEHGDAKGQWFRRLAYNGGRLGFYALLGAIAGAGGGVLTKVAGVNTGLIVLRLIAGLLVLAIALNLLFNWSATRFLEKAGSRIWQRLTPLAKHVLPARTLPAALSAGFLWGALPCGLVYSAVALGATSGSATGGASTMLAFWLGTLPAMLLAGASAQRLAALKSSRGFRIAAGLVMLVIGLLALMPVRMLTG
jgi:sulfite exporter TauE/SafE